MTAPRWEEHEETPLQKKKRQELYYFFVNVISKSVKERLETTIRESRTNDAQALLIPAQIKTTVDQTSFFLSGTQSNCVTSTAVIMYPSQ